MSEGLLSRKPFCLPNPDEPLPVKQDKGSSMNPKALYEAVKQVRDGQLESEFGIAKEDKSRREDFV